MNMYSQCEVTRAAWRASATVPEGSDWLLSAARDSCASGTARTDVCCQSSSRACRWTAQCSCRALRSPSTRSRSTARCWLSEYPHRPRSRCCSASLARCRAASRRRTGAALCLQLPQWPQLMQPTRARSERRARRAPSPHRCSASPTATTCSSTTSRPGSCSTDCARTSATCAASSCAATQRSCSLRAATTSCFSGDPKWTSASRGRRRTGTGNATPFWPLTRTASHSHSGTPDRTRQTCHHLPSRMVRAQLEPFRTKMIITLQCREKAYCRIRAQRAGRRGRPLRTVRRGSPRRPVPGEGQIPLQTPGAATKIPDLAF